jgi:peptide chain release factor 2
MQNRAVAMRILKSRLLARAILEREAEINALRGEKRDIGFGSQIRSYVLHPYQMVKDHRTGVETGNVQAVLDGAIDPFIEAELRRSAHPVEAE